MDSTFFRAYVEIFKALLRSFFAFVMCLFAIGIVVGLASYFYFSPVKEGDDKTQCSVPLKDAD